MDGQDTERARIGARRAADALSGVELNRAGRQGPGESGRRTRGDAEGVKALVAHARTIHSGEFVFEDADAG